jgi:photosystem II stability/assembly factor-like uncharacterized protein
MKHQIRWPLALLLALLSFASFTGCNCGTINPLAPPTTGVDSVAVTPATDTLVVGDTRNFVAVAFDSLDTPITGASITWSSGDPSVVSVTNSGVVTALSEGVTPVIASSGGKSDTAIVAVIVQNGWYIQTSGTTSDLHGVTFRPDGRTGFAVGDGGTIVRTTNAGASWAIQTSGTTNHLRDVWFTTAQTGFAVGEAGTIMRTRNGGSSWTRLTNVVSTDALRGVCFADTSRGWVVGANGTILHTNNAGATWSRLNPTAAQLNSVSFSDSLTGWAVGETGVIAGTRDAGRSWYVVNPAVTALSLRGVTRPSDTRAIAGGFGGVEAFTTATVDSLQWNLGTFGAGNTINSIQMIDGFVGYAVGVNANGLVLRSDDGGATWASQPSSTAVALDDVWFVDTLRGWAVGAGGRIIHTSRGGR